MLVAFDGSPSSQTALMWAAKYAPIMNLEIIVVHVWEYSESTLDVVSVGFGSSGYVGEGDPKIWSQEILKSGVAEVFGPDAKNIQTRSIEGGVIRTFVDLSKEAELLVMGSRGHGKFADLILGSVSESLTAKAKCPVLIVHAATDRVAA